MPMTIPHNVTSRTSCTRRSREALSLLLAALLLLPQNSHWRLVAAALLRGSSEHGAFDATTSRHVAGSQLHDAAAAATPLPQRHQHHPVPTLANIPFEDAVWFEELDEYDQHVVQLLMQEHAKAVAAGGGEAVAAGDAAAAAAAAAQVQQSLQFPAVCGMPHHWDYGADADEVDEELCWGLDAVALEEPPPPPPSSSAQQLLPPEHALVQQDQAQGATAGGDAQSAGRAGGSTGATVAAAGPAVQPPRRRHWRCGAEDEACWAAVVAASAPAGTQGYSHRRVLEHVLLQPVVRYVPSRPDGRSDSSQNDLLAADESENLTTGEPDSRHVAPLPWCGGARAGSAAGVAAAVAPDALRQRDAFARTAVEFTPVQLVPATNTSAAHASEPSEGRVSVEPVNLEGVAAGGADYDVGSGRVLLQVTIGLAGRGARNLPISVIVPIQDFGFDCSTLSGLDACAEPQCLNFFSLVRSANNSVSCQQVAPIPPPGSAAAAAAAAATTIVVPYTYDLLFQFGNSPVLAGLSLGAQSLDNLRFTTMINQFPSVTRDNTNTARVATAGGSFQAYEGVLQRQRTSGNTGGFDTAEPLTFTVGLNLGTTADTYINRLSLPGYSASERGVTAAGSAGAAAVGGASDTRPSVAFGLSSVILGG